MASLRWTVASLLLAIGSAAPPASATVFPCTPAGVQDALVANFGPHTFACAGPTTITLTSTPIMYANTGIIDGEGKVTLSGGGTTRVLYVQGTRTLELRNIVVRDSSEYEDCIEVGGTLFLDNSTVTDCGVSGGAGIEVTQNGILHMTDSSVTNCGGGGGKGGIEGNSGSTVTVTDSTITGNRGGGVSASNLTVIRSLISGNTTSGSGGGIAAGSLSLVDSTVTGNTAGSGGGVSASSGLITGSTISGNTATESIGSRGGGVRAGGGSLTIRNSTIVNNTNGGITNTGGLVLENTTIAGNTGLSNTAIWRPNAGNPTVSIRNSILGGDCSIWSGYSSGGGNIESPGNTCQLTHATDQVNVTAAALHLGALGNYGGLTQTVPLLEPSVAIDAGTACPPPATDQRGVTRPPSCDTGAYELVSEVPALPWLGVVALFAALCVAGLWSLRGRRPA